MVGRRESEGHEVQSGRGMVKGNYEEVQKEDEIGVGRREQMRTYMIRI